MQPQRRACCPGRRRVAAGGGSEKTPPMESAKCAEGLALRGICITRADSYKLPLDDHLKYTGDCNNKDLPAGNVQEAGESLVA